jgi:site-specific recombinase XerD
MLSREPERRRGDLRSSELAGLPTEEVEEEDAALSIRGPDPGDRARAVGEQSEDLSR